MNIKDFKPGQTVYLLSRRKERGQLVHHFISKYIVSSVGRKYVRAAPEGGQQLTEFYKDKDTDEFLSENITWREKTKLFLTEEAANNDIEREMLCSWLRKAAENYKIEGYTLEQLRAVRKILEGQENG